MPRKKKRKYRRKKGIGKFFSNVGDHLKRTLSLAPLIASLAIVFVLTWGVREALYADMSLAIQSVSVKPANAVTPVKLQKIEKAVMEKNLLKVELEAIARELERSPDILNAKVVRVFPSSLEINIERRKPAAFIQTSPNGQYGVVSKDGMVLSVLNENNNSLVTFHAYGMGLPKPSYGKRISYPGFQEAMAFLEEFVKHPFSQDETITKISLDSQGNVTITLGSGPDVRLGRHPLLRLNSMDKMKPVLSGSGRYNINYIDLQFDQIVVKKKK